MLIVEVDINGPAHAWLAARLERPIQPGHCVAIDGDGEFKAAALFHSFTGPNIFVDIAIDRVSAARRLLWAIGDYAFRQLGCRRLTFTADSTNLRAVDLHRRLGAEIEATLHAAGHDGCDINLSVLWADCGIWRKLDGR